MSFNPKFLRNDGNQMYFPIADGTAVKLGEPLKIASNLVTPVTAATDAPDVLGTAAEAKVANDGKIKLLVNLAGNNNVFEIETDSQTWAVGETFAWASVSDGVHTFAKSSTNPMCVAVETVAVAATIAKVRFLLGINAAVHNQAGAATLAVTNLTCSGTLAVAGAVDLDDSVVINESGANKDTRVEGDTATSLLVADASADSVEIGTTVQGALAKFGPTGLILNEAGAAIDTRIEGDTDANLFMVDASADAVGIGVAAPLHKFHVEGSLGSKVGASTAAAGTTTADAGVLPAGTAPIYQTSAADDTKGVRIHASDDVAGRILFIANGVSNKILKVYPPSGGAINGAAADAAFSSASGKGVIAACISAGVWAAW